MRKIPGVDLIHVVYHLVRHWYYSLALNHMHPLHEDYVYVSRKVTHSAKVVNDMVEGKKP